MSGTVRDGGGQGHPMSRDDTLRRRDAALAGHLGEGERARQFLVDPSPRVRATALAALARAGVALASHVAAGLADPEPSVRRRACEVAAGYPDVELVPLLRDRHPSVVESAAWALGERGSSAGGCVGALSQVAVEHADPLCREASVAALGAIGHGSGLAAILSATGDKPAVRRRAVIALAPFEGAEVDAALERDRKSVV